MKRIPESSATFRIGGIDRPVEILVDKWGVPHVYATSEHDVFAGQGFAVARDRLWQIDVWRKRGLGLLSADYGPSFIEADRAARLLLYRGDMDAEWAAYGDGARDIAEAFVRGINAYVTLVEEEPARLPVEFARTKTRPARWAAEDCVRIRSHGPLFNFARELTRAHIVSRFGLDAERARKRLEPDWTIIPAEGLGAEPIPPEVKRIFELGTGQPNFANAELASMAEIGGSNNWAVAGDRTAAGRPILASDPHRLLLLPSLRYVSHLNAPGLDVIGAGEPAIPGVAVGHNSSSAFCFTIHPADQSDLYVYELKPDDPLQYRYGEGWERMEIVEEEFAVRGEAPRRLQLAFTRHGPVLHTGRSARAYALRSIWSLPGSAPYLGALRYMRVKSWDEFVEARSHWQTPTVNHVYADVSGSIGWIMSGKVPTRRDWDGLLPVAGDGSREWDGFMPAEVHPRSHNPARGWVATANEMNLPRDFDHATWRPGFEWCDPTRYQAIARELEKDRSHTLQQSCQLQTSFTSITAERLVAVLADLQLPSEDARSAATMLEGWDGAVSGDSAQAMLFEIWFRQHLIKAVVELLAPGTFAHLNAADIAGYDTLQVTDLIVRPDARFGAQLEARRNALVDDTLAAAWREAVRRGGQDPATWRWDSLHHAQFVHPLSALLAEEQLDTRRVAKGGSGLTPNAADYRPDDFRVIVGASFRMVLDIGAWDDGVFVNAPGQSGNPDSPHYDDHLDVWGREGYLPLPFSRGAVEAATEVRILLEPAGSATG